MLELSWKTALVTGGTRGIGRGIATKLVKSGIKKIALNYLQNEQKAEETARGLRDAGAEVLLVRADIGDAEQLKGMFARIKQSFGSLDVFVHNARPPVGGFYAPPEQTTREALHVAFDSQCVAIALGCQQCVPLMPNGGRIIAITYAPGSKTGSWQPWVAMGAGKAALESTVRYFAVALAKKKITVNAVSPNFVEDSVVNDLPEQVHKGINDWQQAGWTPMGRMGVPADAGNVVSLLCADEANFITGQTIYADGGASAMCPDLPLWIQGIGGQ